MTSLNTSQGEIIFDITLSCFHFWKLFHANGSFFWRCV